MTYIKLSNYCRWNQNENVIRVLNEYPNIDIKHKNGEVFMFAIQNNNIEMLNMLLEYYKKIQLQGDYERLEYKVAKYKLQEILKDAIAMFDISKEVQEVLDKYIPKEEGSDSEQELDDIEDFMGFNSPEIIHNQIEHNENHDQSLDLIGKDTL